MKQEDLDRLKKHRVGAGTDLGYADLRSADLRDADLRDADLRNADLRSANLRNADLRHADLRNANLRDADLMGANLMGAKLPHYQLPEGRLVVWGRKAGYLVKLQIPENAKRTASLVGRKCRAEYAEVVEVIGATAAIVPHRDGATIYRPGELVYPDSYNDDPRVECTHGIHFFATKAEAEEY